MHCMVSWSYCGSAGLTVRKKNCRVSKTEPHKDNWRHRANMELTSVSHCLQFWQHTWHTWPKEETTVLQYESIHILAQEAEKLKEESSWSVVSIGKIFAYTSCETVLPEELSMCIEKANPAHSQAVGSTVLSHPFQWPTVAKAEVLSL